MVSAMHSRAAYRLTMAVTALVLVMCAQVGGAAHEAAVRHVACAHGEMIEAPDLDPSPAGEIRFVRAGGGGAHEHCAIASALRHHSTEPRVAAITTAHVAIVPVVALAAVAAPRARSVYTLAPKTSPPDQLPSRT
jgi:hypothetical protein